MYLFGPGVDPGHLQKSKYSIRTVKFIKATLMEQSNIYVNHMITLMMQSNVSTEATKVYLWIHPCWPGSAE